MASIIFLITIILLYSTSDAFSTTRGIVQSSKIRDASSSRLFVFDVPSSTLDQRFDIEQSSSRSAGTQQIIDNILDECTRYSARRPIMVQFDPEAKLIWRHWRGTVIAETWKSAAWHALWAVAVYIVLQKYPFITKWFKGFSTIWGELLAVVSDCCLYGYEWGIEAYFILIFTSYAHILRLDNFHINILCE